MLNPDLKLDKIVPWQETFYPFDGSLPIKKEDYETHYILSATRPYQFLIGDRSLVMPVTTSLRSTQRDGLELSLFSRSGYQISEKDFDEQSRQTALNRKRRLKNGPSGYNVSVDIEWYLDRVDWSGIGQLNIEKNPKSWVEEIIVTGDEAAYFHALRCLVSGDRSLQSRGSMNAFFPQLEGGEDEYELDLLEPYTFDSFFPTETPPLAANNGQRGTYWNDSWEKTSNTMGEGHSVFLAQKKSRLGVSFTLDDAHFRRQLKISRIL